MLGFAAPPRVPDDPFFRHEYLQTLDFDSLEEALQRIRIEAMKRGWNVGCADSFKSTYATFYCLKGGRQRGKNTTKTGCEWKLGLGPSREKRGRYVIIKSVLHHNHELTPDKYSVYTMDDSQQDLLRHMLFSGITPKYIQRFLRNSGGPELSGLQIRKLKGKDDSINVPETEDLAAYMAATGGVYRRMESMIDGTLYVHAVFTAAQFEVENLRHFGHVIFLDGTQKQNHLKWEIMPVTVIDQFKRIRSAGVFFVSRSDQDVIRWALQTLLSDGPFLAVVQTMITDEDSAFIPAFDTVMEQLNSGRSEESKKSINHVLCAFHKEQNYLKKVAKAGLTRVQRETAKDLFKIVCYSPSKKACDEALDSITALSPKLDSYLKKHVRPILSKFARSYLGSVFTKGYNTTSPAESHNNMIKETMIPGRVYTLRQMREDITMSHRNSELAFRDKIASAFTNTHFTLTVHGAHFAPKILSDIDATLQQALELVCPPDGKVFHPDAPQYVYEVKEQEGLYECSCGRLMHCGLVCAHIIAAMKARGKDYETDYPIHQIAPIWWINAPDDVLVPVNQAGQLEDDAQEGEAPIVSEDVFPNGNPLDDPTTDDQEFGQRDAITLLTDKKRFSDQKERYLTLFHLAKSLASVASRSLDVSLRIREDLQGMLNTLLNIPETASGAVSRAPSDDEGDIVPPQPQMEIVEVRDAVSRPRGRPKRQETAAERFHGHHQCILCGERHQITECTRYEAFAAAVQHNQEEVQDEAHHRCGICSGIGHNRKTCPWLHSNNK